MRRITKKLINSFFILLRSSLRIVKSNIEIIYRFFLTVIKYLLTEIIASLFILGLTVIFTYLGFSNSFALGLSIAIIILSCLLSTYFFALHKSKLTRRRRTLITTRTQRRREEKLAHWIGKTLAQKAPKEWEEYQDWLHDILLDRWQMIERGLPRWKVRTITYWRLIGFCFMVGLIKLRRMVIRYRA